MKATEAKLLDLLKKSPQFVIPIYQRAYSWTEKECRQLWDDILRTGSNDRISVHFVGSIVYIEKGVVPVTHLSPLLVIDGQQRLTTVTLLLAALAGALDQRDESEREPVDGFSPRKLRNYYLLNPEEDGERHYKLLLSQTDKSSLIAIAGGAEQPKEYSLRVTQNFKLFEDLIAGCKSGLVASGTPRIRSLISNVSVGFIATNLRRIFMRRIAPAQIVAISCFARIPINMSHATCQRAMR